MKNIYNKEELKSFETILDSGFTITNSNGDYIKGNYGAYEVYSFNKSSVKEFESLIKALNFIYKNH